MQLVTSDNTELMDVSALRAQDDKLVVSGTIMGTMPIEAVLTPAELRKFFKLLNVSLVFHVLKMFFKR